MVRVACRNVSVRLAGRAVLQDVALTLSPGGLVGIIGPNGAGKSTLLRAVLGLVPIASGTVAIDDIALADLDRTALARRLAYLAQGQAIHWPISVERLVALGRLPHLGPMSRLGPADAAAVARAMARADVTGLRARAATDLSGGERARVLLARALAVEADGLLVDEPLAALDPGHQLDVMTLLKGEAGSGKLVVAVLHDLTIAARFCDRLILLDAGRCVADGAPADVLTPERLAAVYGITARVEGELVLPIRRIDPPPVRA